MQNVIFKIFKMFFLKRVAEIEIQNESAQNGISYSQLRKSKISVTNKFQTLAVYLFLAFYLRSK